MTIAFILLNTGMIISSHLLADHYCRKSHLSHQLATTFLFYIAQVTFTIIFLGSIVKNLGYLYVFLLNGTISATIIFAARKSIKPSIQNILKKFAESGKFILKSKDYFLYLFIFLFVLQAVATLFKIYYLPPHVGDVFSYHLHPMVEWFQQGEILSYTDTPVLRAIENPLGTKPLHLWFVMFLKDITWIEIPQFLFGILLSLASCAVMLKLNIRKNNALRYAVLIYFIPFVLLQSRTCQDHLAFAALMFMGVLYLIDVIYEEQYHSIFLFFIALSLLFGIKKHAVLVIFALFSAALLSRGFNISPAAAFIKKRTASAAYKGIGRGSKQSKEKKACFFCLLLQGISKRNCFRLAAGIAVLLGYGGYIIISNKTLYEELWHRYSGIFFKTILVPLVLLVVLFLLLKWVVKTLNIPGFFKKKPLVSAAAAGLVLLCVSVLVIKNRHFLKPFFLGHRSPVMVTNRSFAAQYPAFNSKIMKNLLAFPFRIKDIGLYTSYTPDLLEKSGFGIQFFAFGLVSYLLLTPLCIFKKKYRNSIMGFILIFSVLLLSVYFFVYFSWANYRSLIFFGVIGIISWAFILEKITPPIYYLRYIDVLIVIMILFNAAACFFEGNMSARQWKTLLTIDNPVDRTSIKYSSLIKKNKDRETWEFIDRYTGPDQPIGFSAGMAAWTFPYFDNQLRRRIFYLHKLPGFRIEHRETNGVSYQMLEFTPDFKASLIQRGVRFIHLSRDIPHKLRIFMPEDIDNVTRITGNLYYFKW